MKMKKTGVELSFMVALSIVSLVMVLLQIIVSYL